MTYRNVVGDAGVADYFLDAETIATYRMETRKQLYDRAKAEGHTEGERAGFELGVQTGRATLQSELDATRRRHLVRPRWVIAPDRDEMDDWVLANMAEEAIATEVSLDAARHDDITFLSATDWADISGKKQETFKGRLSAQGGSFGVTFVVEWTDQNGERRQQQVSWDPGY